MATIKGTKGVLFAFVCYITWGMFPLYWNLLAGLPSLTILANRMLWSAVFMIILVLISNRKEFLRVLGKGKNILLMSVTGILITVNWGTYIYAVNNGHIIEASLGYYINPLINVLLGVIVMGEKLTKPQRIATFLALIGVSYFTWDFGSFPWISIILAGSMGLYGMVKKKANLPPISALTIETLLIAPIALIYLFFAINKGEFVLSNLSEEISLLLVLSGIVTALPLYWFAKAANVVPLSTMGFIQYISPTLQLLLGIFVFGEKFTLAHIVCFAFIWTGLFLLMGGMIRNKIKERNKTLNA